MRKVVQINGRNIYVYRKGHEKKHLGSAFVKYWKEGKVQLPPDGNHRLQVDRTGKVRVFSNPSLDRRKIPHKILGLTRQIHRKNYLEVRNTLKDKMPELLEDRSILQNVSIINQEYATKYKLRKEKIHVHPNIEHVLLSSDNNENALSSISSFMKRIIRRIKVTNGLSDNDRIQLFMNTKKKPIKTSITKIGTLIDKLDEEFLDKIEEVLQSQDELKFDGNTIIEVLMIEMPHGAGRLHALSREEWNLKKCLVHVQNDDNMCAARAIGICLSYLRDGPSSSRYKNMKHADRNEQQSMLKNYIVKPIYLLVHKVLTLMT